MQALSIESQPKQNKYRIAIQKICPVIPKNKLVMTNNNCMLGISINSPATIGNKILAIFDFLNRHGLTKINLLIGDSLYKYTARIKYQYNEQDGKHIALQQGKELIQYYLEQNKFQEQYQLNFFLSSEIEKEQIFYIYYRNMWKLFKTNIDFKRSVLNFSQDYFSRVLNTSNPTEGLTKYSHKYLIKELVIFAILNQKGFNNLFYPGVIQTIYDIITLDHPYLAQLFKNYIFVSLRVSKK